MDLDYDRILGNEQLFHRRKPLDKGLPLRGGDKEFSPDNSWLQAKRIEKFYEERRHVLEEPRVERRGGLVTGEWNPEKQLIELHKEMGKFWTYMGFNDRNRKWLYPEEALFLMETNMMEVWYKGLPLSIQQAYGEFLNSVTINQYLVYAHLRRIGYVVLRHQRKLMSIKHEKKINPKKRQREAKNINISPEHVDTKTSVKSNEDSYAVAETPAKKVKKDMSQVKYEHLGSNDNQTNTEMADALMESSSLPVIYDTGSESEMREEIQIANQSSEVGKRLDEREEEKGFKMGVICGDEWCIENLVESTAYSTWDFNDICFPDIHNSQKVQMRNPLPNLLPERVEVSVDELCFDVERFLKNNSKRNQPCQSRSRFWHEDEENVFDLEFSYPDSSCQQEKISASNWGEYKENLMKRDQKGFISPVQHYWDDEISPLVHPVDAKNTAAVLKKLQIIKGWQQESVINEHKQDKISYDVYKPDAKFRKSNPGVPDHRVCVVRSTEEPPSLLSVTAMHQHCGDNVPLHWAAVDEGEIAFYSFGEINLPTQIFMG